MSEELLDELKGGLSNFTFTGEALINEKSFSGAILKEGKTWKHTDSSFGIAMSDDRKSFVRLYGGYKIDNPVITVFNKDYDNIKIKWEERFNEELWEDLQARSFYTAKIEKDDEGKLITKRFLNALDFQEYLAEHLENGADITASGDIEYSVYGDDNKLNKRYNLKAVYLNESYKRGEETIPKRPPMAIARQTFVLDESAIDKECLRELKKEGQTSIQLFVPQYISQKKVGDSWVEYKQTDPLPVPLVFKASGEKGTEEFDKSVEIIKAIWDKFFKVKGDKVREIALYADIIEGNDTSSGEIVIDAKMQMLIDIGVLKEEDVTSQMTRNGVKKSEFVYVKPVIRNTDDGLQIQMTDDKYSSKIFQIASIDGEDEDGLGAGADLFNESDSGSSTEKMSDNEFSSLFENFD